MSKTQENLAAAFAGESQANRKYLAYAKKAEDEGQSGLAKLFRVAAEGETVHALNHFRAMEGVKNTKENLEDALNGETYEIDEMYPKFIEEAEEGENQAKISFDYANKVEKIHQTLFRKMQERMEKGEEIENSDYFVCPVCGFPSANEAPENCPVCGAPKEKFKRID